MDSWDRPGQVVAFGVTQPVPQAECKNLWSNGHLIDSYSSFNSLFHIVEALISLEMPSFYLFPESLFFRFKCSPVGINIASSSLIV